MGFHGEEVVVSSHRRACAGVCALFCCECGVHETSVLGTSACRCVRCIGVIKISVYIFATEYTHALMYVQFVYSSSRWGTIVEWLS